MIHRLQKDTKWGTGCDQNVWTPESEDDGEEGREGGGGSSAVLSIMRAGRLER